VLDLAARKGCTPNQLALAWLLNQPFPVVPILGTNDPAHLADALGAPGVALTVAEVGWVEG
jgi:aryl-alcohol dehydrogenase-like predicted oxidoreductase